ncbi:RecX family transcriptional regulator [Bifidobacterium imperatoris]|nr:RecX family transcriptional regulator [Bifidobacterium imperatoris]
MPPRDRSVSNNSGYESEVLSDATHMRKASSWRSRSVQAAVVEDSGDVDACHEAALRLLDAAPRSSGALRDRLLGKGYAEDVVEGVIDRLIAVHLINDLDYAESVVRVCANRMMGRRGTMMELARKGVDRKLAERVCGEAEQNGIFEEAAWELGRRVARKTEGLERQVRQRRFWSAGGRKGHNPATLREVAAELLG